jgi:hypothetical protein
MVDAPVAEPVASDPPPREERARLSGYRKRFNLLYIALALVTGIAVGAFIVVALHDNGSTPRAAEPAARFQPTEPGELGAMQIAEQVQRSYRLGNGDELANVVASRNTLQDGQLGLLRVRYQLFRPADGLEDKDTKVEIPRDAIQFSVCGTGQGCVIPGTASADRGLLVRRMGLELALRTMKFDPTVDNVTCDRCRQTGATASSSCSGATCSSASIRDCSRNRSSGSCPEPAPRSSRGRCGRTSPAASTS